MTDAKSLERIKHLIALAGSSELEEARTAAYHAAKLIRELGAKVTLEQSSNERPIKVPDEGATRRVITSKYAGNCRTCKQAYGPGDRVQWMPGQGAAHLSCAWGP